MCSSKIYLSAVRSYRYDPLEYDVALSNVENYLYETLKPTEVKEPQLYVRGDKLHLTGYQSGLSWKIHDFVIKFLSWFGVFKKTTLLDTSTVSLLKWSYETLKEVSIDNGSFPKKYLDVFTSDDDSWEAPLVTAITFKQIVPETIEELSTQILTSLNGKKLERICVTWSH